MTYFICETCGAQYGESAEPPAACKICEDERQYVGAEGQRWTTLEELRGRLRPEIREEEPSLLGLGTEPGFAIGQRALLVQAPSGNILWDCITLLDDEIGARVEQAGGIAAIAISHPHYYGSLVEWARAFDAPVYLHAADRAWVTRPDERIVHWDEETLELGPGLTLLRLGGHFGGGTVLHWAAGAGGRGALLSGDIVQVVPDRGWVSFMYSYPNLIPLPAKEVRRIAETLEPWAFDRIWGAWWDRVVRQDGKDAVRRSAERYVRMLET
jgi:glyoxylase-like metal-dependent hydrolase (beta-lactamase superfamily II)